MVRNPFNNRPGLKALLLIGGAFSLAAAYLALNYRLVADPASFFDPKFYIGATNELVAAVSLTGHPNDLKNLIARLPETAQSSLREYPFGNRPAVIYVERDRETGAFRWVYSTAEKFPLARFRLIDKKAVGYGFFNENALSEPDSPLAEWTLPFELYASDHTVRLKVGRAYRGFFQESSPVGENKRRLTSPQDDIGLYLYDPLPPSVTLRLADALLPQGNAPFPEFLGVLRQLINGPLEIAIGRKTADAATSTFIIRGRILPQLREKDGEIALQIRKSLGASDPDTISVLLPDQTTSDEFRNSFRGVRMEELELKSGRLTKFFTAGGLGKIAYFKENSGDAWIADSVDTVKGAMLSSIGKNQAANDVCLPGGEIPGLIVSPRLLSGSSAISEPFQSLFASFTTISFLLNNRETGLFTICGYF